MKKIKKVIIILALILIYNMFYTIFATNEELIETNTETEVKVSYEYKEKTNTVLATITSDIEFKPTKISWKLSEDKKHYTFEFSNNTKYETTVIDINGKVTKIQIEVTRS